MAKSKVSAPALATYGLAAPGVEGCGALDIQLKEQLSDVGLIGSELFKFRGAQDKLVQLRLRQGQGTAEDITRNGRMLGCDERLQLYMS